jgi:nucleotide-binding universal stress UspA family protein
MKAGNRVAVVGVDMGPTGDDAIFDGLRLLSRGVVDTLHLLHVVSEKQLLDAGERRVFEAENDALAHAPAALEARVLELASLTDMSVESAQIKGHGRIGDPVVTLLQMCVDYDADILIVGTHGRKGIDRMVAGSVAEQLVRRAHCPVLVARPKDYEGLTRTALPDAPYAPGEAPARRHGHEQATHGTTTLDSWSPSDNGPTGFRIV